MTIGTQLPVGPLLVEKLGDVTWAVRTPDGDWACVSEDDEEFGYLGEGWAVEAVLVAEQRADELEVAGV